MEPEQSCVDQAAINCYRSVLTAAGDAGLRVWVCLLNTAIPVWFADRAGFAAQDALGTWLRWVDFAAATFGDLAGGWIPFNTPTSYAHKAPVRRRSSAPAQRPVYSGCSPCQGGRSRSMFGYETGEVS